MGSLLKMQLTRSHFQRFSCIRRCLDPRKLHLSGHPGDSVADDISGHSLRNAGEKEHISPGVSLRPGSTRTLDESLPFPGPQILMDALRQGWTDVLHPPPQRGKVPQLFVPSEMSGLAGLRRESAHGSAQQLSSCTACAPGGYTGGPCLSCQPAWP